MVWPNGERLRRWRERRELKKESERIIKARGEIPELELKLARKKELTKVIGEQKALEREITETERQREIARLRREAAELRELAEIRKTGREIAEARRVLRPQYGGLGRLAGELGKVGAYGQRMLGAAPARPTTPIPRPRAEYRIKRIPYMKKGKIMYREKVVKVKAKAPRVPVPQPAPRPIIGLGTVAPSRPLIGLGSVPSVKVKPLKYQAPRGIISSGTIPARPLISLWPQAQQKKKRR